MPATEQIWFLIAIGGILLMLEGAIAGVAKVYTKLPEWAIKLIVGVVIIALALWGLWPKT
jgi:hypothetical protein